MRRFGTVVLAAQSGMEREARVVEQQRTVADTLVDCLVSTGVDTVFGVPGEHCLDIVDAIGRHPQIGFVAVRHESNAAFMADANAKLTGGVGACIGTASVGAVNLMSGLNVSHHDSTPVIAILGQVSTAFRGRDAWQELDLTALLDQLTRYSTEVVSPDGLVEAAMRALAFTRAGRPGPVALAVPDDVARMPCTTPAPPTRTLRLPDLSPDDARMVVARLRTASRPLVLAGGGVSRPSARADLVRFADVTGLPVVTAFRRPDVFPGDHAQHAGSLGLGATPRTTGLVREADLLLVLGSRLSELTTLRYTVPSPGQEVVHVDVDAATLARQQLGERLPLVADAGNAVRALFGQWPRGERVPAWWDGTEVQTNDGESPEGRPTPPSWNRAAAHLQTLLPDDAVLTSDAGDFFVPVSRSVSFHGERRYLGPTSGTMGYGLPAAIAAKLVSPQRTVVATCGDGGFGMSLIELATAALYHVPVIVVVFNDGAYGSIERHQRNRYAGRLVGVTLHNPAFTQLAEAFGVFGARVDDPNDFPGVFARAVSSGLPALIDVPATSG